MLNTVNTLFVVYSSSLIGFLPTLLLANAYTPSFLYSHIAARI